MDLVGSKLPAADGTNSGVIVLRYEADSNEYLVLPIHWSTEKIIGESYRIAPFKLSYRYREIDMVKIEESRWQSLRK